MKTTILNILTAFGFLFFSFLAGKEFMGANIKTMTIPYISANRDTLSVSEKIDSIDKLNNELNENTFETLQCDNQILSIKKKNLLQSRISHRRDTINLPMEDSCVSFHDTLNKNQ
jgi:hypothetical protein